MYLENDNSINFMLAKWDGIYKNPNTFIKLDKETQALIEFIKNRSDAKFSKGFEEVKEIYKSSIY